MGERLLLTGSRTAVLLKNPPETISRQRLRLAEATLYRLTQEVGGMTVGDKSMVTRCSRFPGTVPVLDQGKAVS